MNKMKKILSLILSLVLIIGCAQLPTNLISAEEGETIVYVADADNGGSDETGDGSEGLPYATINKAQADLTEGGKIIVTGTVDFDGGVAHNGMITIAGANTSAKINLVRADSVINDKYGNKADWVLLKGDTRFENIYIFRSTDSTYTFMTNGYDIEFGSGVTGNTPTWSKPVIRFGPIEANSTKIIRFTADSLNSAKGGSHQAYQIRIGNGALTLSSAQRTVGGVEFTLNGGAVHNLYFDGGSTYLGDVNITINGGSFDDKIGLQSN